MLTCLRTCVRRSVGNRFIALYHVAYPDIRTCFPVDYCVWWNAICVVRGMCINSVVRRGFQIVVYIS
jgi:hypothetical protein